VFKTVHQLENTTRSANKRYNLRKPNPGKKSGGAKTVCCPNNNNQVNHAGTAGRVLVGKVVEGVQR